MENTKELPLSGSLLKILALFSMTIDHVGLILLEDFTPFRIIGRISFPIFAYMIAEGCRYTHDKRKHFARIFLLAVLCQAAYYIAEHSLYQGVLMSFSLSILLIDSIDWAKEKKKAAAWLLPLAAMGFAVFLCVILPNLWEGSGFAFDYGIWGVLLPVFVSLSREKGKSLALMAVGLFCLCASMGGLQWYSLFSLFFIALYSGKEGFSMKGLFYVYYPLHLAVIYLIAILYPV